MDNKINRTTFFQSANLMGVGNKPENDKAEAKKEKEDKPVVNEKKTFSPDETLSFLAAQSIAARPIEPQKVLDIAKYNTPEQIAGIKKAMTETFMPLADTVAKEIDKFVGKAVSDEAKMDLTVEVLNAIA